MMKKKKMKFDSGQLPKYLIYAFFVWFILSCLVIPNINTIFTVFFENGEFTLEPLQKLLSSEKAMKSLRNSCILAPALSVTVGFVGISLVLITEYFDIRGARMLRIGYMTTLIYGGIILVSGYKFIYGNNGFLTNIFAKVIPNFPTDWFQGFWAVLFVMTFACTSNHMIFLRNAMRAVDFQTVEAAQNMGASQIRILLRVVLPVLTPSLLAVTILTFITGLSATSAPLLIGGNDFQTITPMILTFSKTVNSRPLAALLALFLGIATILLLTVMMKIEKRGHYMSISKVKTTIRKQKIRNPIINVLVHIYAYILFLIYVLPVVLIVLFSFTDAKTIATRKLSLSAFTLDNYKTILTEASAYRPFIVSVIYSLLSAVAVAILVLMACRIIQKNKNKASAALEYGLLIPWLLPTTLIAIGLITTYNTPRFWMFNKILTGTSVIMFIGYVIIKIPFTLRMTKAAFFSLDDSLEDAARSLGAKGFYTFRRVILPIVLPTVLAIFALNFNGLLGDYDMSVFMYHPLNQPLGVYIKSLTDAQTNADNSALSFVYAVLMMIISGTVVYFVYGRGDKTKVKK
ncbi:iron ABC transporter permease [Coprococcus sp. AF27-8]|jgi:iron(III) transport system permease protein|nr:iron ABC transporter permease [Coprococcus sp. AF27-8]